MWWWIEPDEPEGRSQQRVVSMYNSRGGRWSLTSLGFCGLLLDQQPQLFSCMHSVYCTHLRYRASHSQQPCVDVCISRGGTHR